MTLMRRFFVGTFAAFVALSACMSSTSPDSSPELVPDPSLSFETAHARWTAARPTGYTFELDVQGAMVPSPGFARVTVSDGRLVDVRRAATGEPISLAAGFTIDQFWDRLIAARAAGETVAELQYSREGIPIQAMVGTFANDGGAFYRLRAFEQTR
jgi:hypothetical protein